MMVFKKEKFVLPINHTIDMFIQLYSIYLSEHVSYVLVKW